MPLKQSIILPLTIESQLVQWIWHCCLEMDTYAERQLEL